MGVPVVAFAHGGVGEQLEALFPEGRVPCFDEQALAEAVCRVLENDPRPQQNHLYLKSQMLQQTLAVYQQMAANLQS